MEPGRLSPHLEIVEGYRPGAIGRIAEMHGRYYAREWDFGVFFEAKVARESAEFFERMDPATDRVWLVLAGSRIMGSLVVDGGEDPSGAAHLRWFVLDDGCRGAGVGAELMRRAAEFCDARGVGCYLTTFAGLDAARALYERFGFVLTEETSAETWGRMVSEQRFERPPG
jgi:GNAT superfamily N-acetyltransferase